MNTMEDEEKQSEEEVCLTHLRHFFNTLNMSKQNVT